MYLGALGLADPRYEHRSLERRGKGGGLRVCEFGNGKEGNVSSKVLHYMYNLNCSNGYNPIFLNYSMHVTSLFQ